MATGMMWFDNDPKRTLEQKIKRGFEYCQDKYKTSVLAVWTHPSCHVEGDSEVYGETPIIFHKSIRTNHFWYVIDYKKKEYQIQEHEEFVEENP